MKSLPKVPKAFGIAGKKILFSLLLLSAAVITKAQNLVSFSAAMQMGKENFISIENKKVYTAETAAAVKESLDFMYSITVSGKDSVKEFHNMSAKADKAPKSLQGTQSGINVISWDADLWQQCKTVADLKRMAGHITRNSFSHFATIANNHTGAINYPCFIFETAKGKRGVMYVTNGKNGGILVEVKMEP